MTPAEELREAARLMRERADAMYDEMDRMPASWECGYRAETSGALGGPAGELAGPWDPEANRAVAGWLEAESAKIVGLRSELAFTAISGWPSVKVARAYLGTSAPAVTP